MTDRIHCNGCGAESFADGAILYCKRCHQVAVEDNARMELQIKQLLDLCRDVKDYLDHPDQTSHAAWNLIGRLEYILGDVD